MKYPLKRRVFLTYLGLDLFRSYKYGEPLMLWYAINVGSQEQPSYRSFDVRDLLKAAKVSEADQERCEDVYTLCPMILCYLEYVLGLAYVGMGSDVLDWIKQNATTIEEGSPEWHAWRKEYGKAEK